MNEYLDRKSIESVVNYLLATIKTSEVEYAKPIITRLAPYFVNKNWLMLYQWLCTGGKGHNETSKRAFCQFLGCTPVYDIKTMKSIVAEWTGVSVKFIDLHANITSARESLYFKESELLEAFSNSESIKELIDDMSKEEGVEIRMMNRRAHLVGKTKTLKLSRKEIRAYAEAKLNFLQADLDFISECAAIRTVKIAEKIAAQNPASNVADQIVELIDAHRLSKIIFFNNRYFMTNKEHSKSYELHSLDSAHFASLYIACLSPSDNRDQILLPEEMINFSPLIQLNSLECGDVS